jgi:hypothetical protein
MTGAKIAAAILKAESVEDASQEDVQIVAQGIQHSLKNLEGKGVQIVGEARPAKWRLVTNEQKTPPWRLIPARFLSWCAAENSAAADISNS